MNALREEEFTVRLIGRTAWRLAGKEGITADDVPDIQQDLWLDLLERLPDYRPDRGHLRAFIARVVRNKACSILKARTAAKRGGGVPDLSLNCEYEDEDGEPAELHESISVDDYLRWTRASVRSQEERQDLAFDLRRMVDSLAPPQRAVCLLLIDRDVCDVANVVGLPRSTLRDLIKRLRATWAKSGLEKYCG